MTIWPDHVPPPRKRKFETKDGVPFIEIEDYGGGYLTLQGPEAGLIAELEPYDALEFAKSITEAAQRIIDR